MSWSWTIQINANQCTRSQVVLLQAHVVFPNSAAWALKLLNFSPLRVSMIKLHQFACAWMFYVSWICFLLNPSTYHAAYFVIKSRANSRNNSPASIQTSPYCFISFGKPCLISTSLSTSVFADPFHLHWKHTSLSPSGNHGLGTSAKSIQMHIKVYIVIKSEIYIQYQQARAKTYWTYW